MLALGSFCRPLRPRNRVAGGFKPGFKPAPTVTATGLGFVLPTSASKSGRAGFKPAPTGEGPGLGFVLPKRHRPAVRIAPGWPLRPIHDVKQRPASARALAGRHVSLLPGASSAPRFAFHWTI